MPTTTLIMGMAMKELVQNGAPGLFGPEMADWLFKTPPLRPMKGPVESSQEKSANAMAETHRARTPRTKPKIFFFMVPSQVIQGALGDNPQGPNCPSSCGFGSGPRS